MAQCNTQSDWYKLQKFQFEFLQLIGIHHESISQAQLMLKQIILVWLLLHIHYSCTKLAFRCSREKGKK